jgi:hypothetical protein
MYLILVEPAAPPNMLAASDDTIPRGIEVQGHTMARQIRTTAEGLLLDAVLVEAVGFGTVVSFPFRRAAGCQLNLYGEYVDV